MHLVPLKLKKHSSEVSDVQSRTALEFSKIHGTELSYLILILKKATKEKRKLLTQVMALYNQGR